MNKTVTIVSALGWVWLSSSVGGRLMKPGGRSDTADSFSACRVRWRNRMSPARTR